MSIVVRCDIEEKGQQLRKPRFFTFKTLDENLTVNLEFSIPFITIPIKKAMQSAQWGLPTVNFNLASLALGGAVVLGTTVLLPLLMKKQTLFNPNHQYARVLDTAEFGADSMLDYVNQMFVQSPSFSGCPQRIACWSAQKPASNDKSTRVWNQIFSNKFLSTMINSTAVEEAMLSGRQGRDCTMYSPCSLQEDHVPILMNNLAVLINSN